MDTSYATFKKRFFITKSRKSEDTEKTMKIFVFFRFRVFVIAFISVIPAKAGA